jgi:flagellar basal-body rod modification protein FlgD
MDVKSSTKTYADRKDPNFITRDSSVKTQSATEMAKLGQENVGDVLNRIADPEWVDPAKKIRAVGDKNLDKDAFMKLMLTQMKHQDPTNPMQAHEMAAQLAAFTSVEQMQNMNSTLEGMKKAQAPMQQFEALNLIGKSVAGDSAQLTRVKGDTAHTFQYRLQKEAEDVSVKVKNSQGEVVRSYTLKLQKGGANSLDWNGQDERGVVQPPGDYSLAIEATDKGGQRVGVETQFDGLITGVNFTGDGPLLLVGNRTVKFSDIRKIVDPRLKNDDQKIAKNENNPTQDLKVSGNQQETVKTNLEQIAMARGMLNKVEKESGKELAP